jgi:hypothetical protein
MKYENGRRSNTIQRSLVEETAEKPGSSGRKCKKAKIPTKWFEINRSVPTISNYGVQTNVPDFTPSHIIGYADLRPF